MMKPTKTELRRLVSNYGTACANAETFKATRDREAYEEQISHAQSLFDQIYDDIGTICDDAEQVEWVPRSEPVRLPINWDMYITNGDLVVQVASGYVPDWCTHWAPCPPRRMPKPPKGGEEDGR